MADEEINLECPKCKGNYHSYVYMECPKCYDGEEKDILTKQTTKKKERPKTQDDGKADSVNGVSCGVSSTQN